MNNDLDRLKIPAIGLIVVGFLNGATGFLALVSGLLRLAGIIGENKIPINEAEKMGFYFGTFFGYGISFLSEYPHLL